MRFLTVILLCVSSIVVMANNGFLQADKIMKDAVRVRELTAKTKVTTAIEIDNLEKLCSSAKIQLSVLLKKIESLQAQYSQSNNDNKYISNAIKTEIEKLDALSDFLDEFYVGVVAQIPKNCDLKKSIDANFKTKSLPEKLRSTISLLSLLKRIDKEIKIENEKVSSGLFIRVQGENSRRVTTMKVEGVVR